MSQENVDLVTRASQAFGAGDMDTVVGMLAGTEWHEAAGMPYGGVHRGPQEILGNVLGPISQDVQDFSAKPDEIHAVGDDRVLSLGRYRGKGSAGEVDVPYAHLWTVRDGALVKFVQYADTKLFRDAVGQ